MSAPTMRSPHTTAKRNANKNRTLSSHRVMGERTADAAHDEHLLGIAMSHRTLRHLHQHREHLHPYTHIERNQRNEPKNTHNGHSGHRFNFNNSLTCPPYNHTKTERSIPSPGARSTGRRRCKRHVRAGPWPPPRPRSECRRRRRPFLSPHTAVQYTCCPYFTRTRQHVSDVNE